MTTRDGTLPVLDVLFQEQLRDVIREILASGSWKDDLADSTDSRSASELEKAHNQKTTSSGTPDDDDAQTRQENEESRLREDPHIEGDDVQHTEKNAIPRAKSKTEVAGLVQLHARQLGLDFGVIQSKLGDAHATGNADEEFWKFCAKCCADLTTTNPNYSVLGGTILYEWIQSQNPYTYSEFTAKGAGPKGFSPEYASFVSRNAETTGELDVLVTNTPYTSFEYPGMCTLVQSYLTKIKTPSGYIIETPAMMYMRVACFLHFPDFSTPSGGSRPDGSPEESSRLNPSECLENIRELYEVLCTRRASLASPCYFNAAGRRPSMASCFCARTWDDMDAISDSWKEAALVSMNKGGLGVDFSCLRHSEIGINGGVSRGIIPWTKILNEIMNAVDQGSVRKGSATGFLRDFHVDFEEFCELRRPNGPESMRTRDLFLSVVLSDLF
jgi:hypothetical protein